MKRRLTTAFLFGLFGSGGLLGGDLVLLHGAHEALLLLGSLEAAVAELGRRVDELESDLLEGHTLGLRDERLAQRDRTLLGAHHAALDHDEVLTHNTVVREASLIDFNSKNNRRKKMNELNILYTKKREKRKRKRNKTFWNSSRIRLPVPGRL